jgi:XrtN system VIT domain protein
MYLLKARLRDSLYQSGLICLAISLFFFCLPLLSPVKEGQEFGLFVPSFAMTLIYFGIFLAQRKRLETENRIHYIFLLLVLSLVSAYSLNRVMAVFEDSTPWFSVLLVTSCVNFAAFAYADALPKWTVHLMSFVSGVSWVAFAYLSLYLLPIYALGIIGFFLLGASLHAFVPLLFTIYSIKLLGKSAEAEKRYWWSFLTGLLLAVAFVVGYTIMWNNNKRQLNNAWYQSTTGGNELPVWVNVAQNVPDNFFTRKLLRTDLVYSIPGSERGNLFWRIPDMNSLDETKKHDPLVMTAELLTGKLGLTNQDRVKVLTSMHHLRHETGDRLWSGEHLSTESINTEVRFWPDCNITYTEKTITVTNNNPEKRWRPQEEALYTFYMPEGAVVTSLSLWVNGKEEKGILTTKEKADSAYKTIVGAERRDPSVVHWQEGNSVLVRVFPVLAGESRMFKIGITAPLERIKGKLRYENIYFKGPVWDNAKEDILIDFEQPVSEFQMPASFTSMSRQQYKRHGRYEPIWNMLINDPGLANCSFSFDEKTYSLLPYQRKLSHVQFQKIYLDINRSWSKSEFNSVVESVNDKEIYVYDSVIKRLTAENSADIWGALHSKQFSLFPLYEIKDPGHSLLITKNLSISPTLDDLEGTPFMAKTMSLLQNDKRINLYDLGADLSPYLKSFKEFRVFQYDRGDIDQLQGWLRKNFFPEDSENDNDVIIHRSDMVIHKADGSNASTGPDHLMRLFSYNHIMQKLGRGQFLHRNIDDSLVEEARKAYVVTPVSSLVVLETQKDYDRFNIHDGKSSLGNASLNSKGAVPEPHEWAIIILSFLLITYLVIKRKYRLSR